MLENLIQQMCAFTILDGPFFFFLWSFLAQRFGAI
jgi:hypothetical protein